jgi:ABC-type dipeptide/oligopeptide/nickel transport system permease subunit
MSASRALRLVPLGLVVALASLGTLLAPARPDRITPALAWSAPTWARPFGSGEAGVDLLAVVSHAELSGILLAVAVAVSGFVLGTPLGAFAAMSRGLFERFVARTCDLIQAFPTFLFALVVLSAVRDPGRVHLGMVFALTAWAPFARLSLVETRVLRDAAFVEAGFALGLGRGRVVVRHVLPNLLGVVAVQLGSTGAAIVVAEAAFAFLGMGPKDGVSLGAVLDQGVAAMLRAPHVLWAGAACVFLTSASMLVAGTAVAIRPERRARS